MVKTTKVLLLLLTALALSFIFFLILSFTTFPEKIVLHAFRNSWVMNNSLKNWIEWIIPVTSTAIVLSYGMFFSPRRVEQSDNSPDLFHRIVSGSLVLILLLTLLYTFGTELLLPRTYRNLEDFTYRTELARRSLKAAEVMRAAGDYQKALGLANLYLAINPEAGDPVYADKYKDFQRMLSDLRKGNPSETEGAEETGTVLHTLDQRDAADYLREAQECLNREDYFSAYYYASLAVKIAPARTDAKQLARDAIEKIESMEPDSGEIEQKLFYQKKMKAFDMLNGTDQEAIDAYYIFMELAKQAPDDPDINIYLPKSIEKISKISFFTQEIEKTRPVPGIRNIAFLNKLSIDCTEIIYFDKFVEIPNGRFVEGIEAIAIDEQGRIKYHLTAPFGKLVPSPEGGDTSTRLIMTSIDETDQSVFGGPTYLKGSRGPDLAGFLLLRPSVTEIPKLTLQTNYVRQLNLPGLWSIVEIAESFGHEARMVRIEVFRRLIHPFSFLIFSYLAIALGWSLRIRSGKISLLSILSIPLYPFVVRFLVMGYQYLNQVLTTYLLLLTGFWAALILLVVFQGVVFICVLIYLSTCSIRAPNP